MNNVFRSMQLEFNAMPEYHLKDVAIKSYGLTKKSVSKMEKKTLVDFMISVEFKNAYK